MELPGPFACHRKREFWGCVLLGLPIVGGKNSHSGSECLSTYLFATKSSAAEISRPWGVFGVRSHRLNKSISPKALIRAR
jgi:hypothetical protein